MGKMEEKMVPEMNILEIFLRLTVQAWPGIEEEKSTFHGYVYQKGSVSDYKTESSEGELPFQAIV